MIILPKKIEDWISILETFPQNLEFLTRILSEKQLGSTYREGV